MVKRLSLPVPIRVCWFIFVCYVSLFMFVSLFIKTNEIPNTAESQNPTFSWYFLRLRFTMIKQYIHVIKIRLVQVKLLLFLPCLDWRSSIFSEVFPLYGCLSVRVIFLWHVSQQILTFLFRHAICQNLFLNKFDVNSLLNVNFAYFAYSHQSRHIISVHCLTDILGFFFKDIIIKISNCSCDIIISTAIIQTGGWYLLRYCWYHEVYNCRTRQF